MASGPISRYGAASINSNSEPGGVTMSNGWVLRWVSILAMTAETFGCNSNTDSVDVHGSDATTEASFEDGDTQDAGSSDNHVTEAGTLDASDAGSLTGARPVRIQFRAAVGAMPFNCTQVFHDMGATHTDWTPADFRFYVHDVRLLTANNVEVPVQLDEDGTWQHAGVALLDFEDKTGTCSAGTTATNDHVTGQVPAGTYTGIRFRLGVPFALDHLDHGTQPAPLNVDALFWVWQAGYKFLRIEGQAQNPASALRMATPNTFLIHIGSTDCPSDDVMHPPTGPCTHPNVPEVTLASFDPSTQTIVADLAQLVTDVDLDIARPMPPPGCMSGQDDPDCPLIFAHLGLPFGTTPAPATQAFFRVQ